MGFQAGIISLQNCVFKEGGAIFPRGVGSAVKTPMNGTANCGSIVFGQVFGTADSFGCCEPMLHSWAI